VRVSKVVKAICAFGRDVVIIDADMVGGPRSRLVVWVRAKVRPRGRCGRCCELAAWLDNGGGPATAA
jgi:hypothetical protein